MTFLRFYWGFFEMKKEMYQMMELTLWLIFVKSKEVNKIG